MTYFTPAACPKAPASRARHLLPLLMLSACQFHGDGANVPVWPEEAPPEYPGTPPAQPSSNASAPTDVGADPAPAPASSSPLARQYHDRPALQVLRGKATYYADSLAGNSTASGQPYRPRDFTAAHRSLPFGTVVRVIRTDLDAQTYVTINDRGPFGKKDRIIDLSRAAATELDMLRAGVVPVHVEVLTVPSKN